MELRARITGRLPLANFTGKNGTDYKKATLIVETIEQYPKKVALQNIKKADEFNSLPDGMTFIFSIDVESREYNGRWYSEINCWAWNPEQSYQPR